MSRSSRERVLITTTPFGEISRRPLELLEDAGISYTINPHSRRLTPGEIVALIPGHVAVIAGTEPIGREVLATTGLRLIARVGIGLDNVDLQAARTLGVQVAYTPDAPSPAVAELTVGLMIDLLRRISPSDRDLRTGKWSRYPGGRLAACTVGVIGAGRVGGRVIRHLLGGFEGVRILANDIDAAVIARSEPSVAWVSKETIYAEADVVSLHVPLTASTWNLVGHRQFAQMKRTAVVVNTSRGGVVVEAELEQALRDARIAGAAVDVFEREPYCGPLTERDNCVLTPHLGSMTADCRARMEYEAALEAVSFIQSGRLRSPVPDEEYRLRTQLVGRPHVAIG
ncbi:MAG: phosphoglycerate dehydrogenase [Vicinamibacterales bacterium]